ncbi:MAG: hypothetical protein EPO25_09505 [Gammaproteobacteria bacterium]|nr:MAG: hypothetical protein EPO25_09505 [Gammaproteobacteria bacterium]
MAELKPAVGLVIRHAYLWWSEARQAREEGSKDRPCVIVHLRVSEHQELETYICPITHTPPEVLEKAIEIRAATKERLHLDDQRSWIITTEINRFIWPGPDLRPVPGGGYSYGLLPAVMTRDLVAQVKANAQDRSLLVVSRTE